MQLDEVTGRANAFVGNLNLKSTHQGDRVGYQGASPPGR